MSNCNHPRVECIDPYELIRKYKCLVCGEVMMCACEEEFARRFLPHQLSQARELETQRRIPVTKGFQRNICNTCRGLPEEAYPKRESYGRASKVYRYYWREIFFETTLRFANWAESQGYANRYIARQENPSVYKHIEKEVVEGIKELHESSPKYIYQEKSQSEVMEENDVEVIKLEGTYISSKESGARILENGNTYSAEEFAALHYRRKGYDVLFTESVPFHVLFGIFMWLLIQDPADPRGRIVCFGDRTAFDEGRKGEVIWTRLPEDFGGSGYAQRRAKSIEEHFAVMLPQEKEELYWAFDYWLDPSEGLRQYLWAHRPQDVEKAREVLSILPADIVCRILQYLLADYWGRYIGWPDLLIYGKHCYFFAEVKSSGDKLSEDQKNWIRGNTSELHLPFKLIKIHKRSLQTRIQE